MIINSIKIKNFRQFKNVNIDFSTTSDKKFTILLGDNGFGKTTLVKAFVWCLYRSVDYDDLVLNNEVASNLVYGENNSAETVVEVDLFHNDKKYHVTTRQKFSRNISGNISKGEPVTLVQEENPNKGCINYPAKDSNFIIDSILPNNLKDFFFFEGERNSISTLLKKGNLSTAVSNILGITKLEVLRDYYKPNVAESVTSRFRNKLIADDPIEQATIAEKIKELQDEIETNNGYITDAENENQHLEEKYTEKEQILKDNKEVGEKQEEKLKLEKENGKITLNYVNDFFNVIKHFSNNFKDILLSYIFEQNDIKNFFKESKLTGNKTLSNINAKAIDEMINRGYCVCGTKIETGNDAYKHLIESKNFMMPLNYDSSIKNYLRNEIDSQNYSLEYDKKIGEYVSQVLDNSDLVWDNEQRIKEIKSDINGMPNIRDIQSEIENIRKSMSTNDGRIEVYNTKNGQNSGKIKDLQKKLDLLIGHTEQNEFYFTCVSYCEYLYKKISENIVKRKNDSRTKLVEYVNEVFAQIYHGNERKITIDENYKIECVLKDGKKLGLGSGVKTVTSYSFVAGLIKLIKEQTSDDESESLDNVYPLVMDAPFSTTDEIHIENICKTLPKYCNQIIIAVMEKDFNRAVKNIDHLIGKKYKFKKINENITEIEEVK